MNIVISSFFKKNIVLKKIELMKQQNYLKETSVSQLNFVVGNDLEEQNTQEFQKWMRMCYKAKIIDLVKLGRFY